MSEINSLWTALIAGLITSPHCLIMCGPLAYVVLSSPESNQKLARFNYHLGRLLSFTALGVLAGFLGDALLDYWQIKPLTVLPWALVVFLVIFAIGLDRLIPKLPFAKRFFQKLTLKITQYPRHYAALVLGLATPLLPCGPLYMVAWVALASGSAVFGGQIMGAFAVGTVPLFLAAQLILPKVENKLSPKFVHNAQRILALGMAIFITYRLIWAVSPEAPLVAECCGGH